MDEDTDDVVDILVGSAIAKRFKQFMPRCTETEWFAVALAAMEILKVVNNTEGDGLQAIDEFFELEEALAK